MPKRTIYLSQENTEIFDRIPNKSKFVRDLLKSSLWVMTENGNPIRAYVDEKRAKEDLVFANKVQNKFSLKKIEMIK